MNKEIFQSGFVKKETMSALTLTMIYNMQNEIKVDFILLGLDAYFQNNCLF